MVNEHTPGFSSVCHELADIGLWFACFGVAAGADRDFRHKRRAPTRWRLSANDARVRTRTGKRKGADALPNCVGDERA
jgi:hypothetical protein